MNKNLLATSVARFRFIPLSFFIAFLISFTVLNPAQGSVFNVKDYGAIGNGTHDDTAAFQSAINAAEPSGEIYVPAGNYVINSMLKLNNNLSMKGVGTTSILNGPANGAFYKTKAGCYVNQAIVQLTGANTLNALEFTTRTKTGQTATMGCVNVELNAGVCQIRNVTFAGYLNSCIEMVSPNNVTISGCSFNIGTGATGNPMEVLMVLCQGYPSQNITFNNNNFLSTGANSSIMTTSFATSSSAAGTMSNLVITNNQFLDAQAAYTGYPFADCTLTSTSGCTITGNSFTGNNIYGIALNFYGTGSLSGSAGPLSNIDIENNTFANCGWGASANPSASVFGVINMTAFPANNAPNGTPGIQNITVKNNKFNCPLEQIGSYLLSECCAISLNGGTVGSLKNATISNNTVLNSGWGAIMVDATNSATITNNVINSSKGTYPNSGEGIVLGVNESGYYQISGNLMYWLGTAAPSLQKSLGIPGKAAIDIKSTGAAPRVAANLCIPVALTTSIGSASKPANIKAGTISNNFYGPSNAAADNLQYFIWAGNSPAPFPSAAQVRHK